MPIKYKPFFSFRLSLDGLKEKPTLKFNVRNCSIPKFTIFIDSLAKFKFNQMLSYDGFIQLLLKENYFSLEKQ